LIEKESLREKSLYEMTKQQLINEIYKLELKLEITKEQYKEQEQDQVKKYLKAMIDKESNS